MGYAGPGRDNIRLGAFTVGSGMFIPTTPGSGGAMIIKPPPVSAPVTAVTPVPTVGLPTTGPGMLPGPIFSPPALAPPGSPDTAPATQLQALLMAPQGSPGGGGSPPDMTDDSTPPAPAGPVQAGVATGAPPSIVLMAGAAVAALWFFSSRGRRR